MELPETLTVTVRTNLDTVTDSVYGSEYEETTVNIPVTWTSQPEYDMDTEGEYVFTPVIEGYTANAELPQITVTVRAAMMRQAFSLVSGDNVAQIGETGYPTMQEAVDAVANGQTIQLLKNIVVSEPVSISGNKSFTLDLNGCVLSKEGVYKAISHSGSGTLTITDSSSMKSGKITASTAAIVLEEDCSGNLLVIGGTLSITSTGHATIYNESESSQVSIEEGEVTSAHTAIANQSTGSVSVSGGSVKGANFGITNQSTGRVSVSDGSVTSAGYAAIFNQSGRVSVSGGSVTSTASDWPAIYCYHKGSLSISGTATVTSANSNPARVDVSFGDLSSPCTLAGQG